MLISVTAPSKGLGQSVTTINLAVMTSKLIGDRSLIIDINKNCKDIVYYLSNSVCAKGLDDFKSLLQANMLSSKTLFNSCVKNVHESLDIMDSNESFDLTNNELKNLINYTKAYYPVTFVDTISGRNSFSKDFFNKSDVIIIIVNQTINSVSKILEDDFYEKYKDKVIFVVNQYMNSYNNKKIRYTIKEINKDLSKVKVKKERIFKLDFDVDLMNECNENGILNYLFSNSWKNNEYLNQLEKISQYLLTNFADMQFDELIALTKQQKRDIFASIFKLNKRSNLNEDYE